MNNSIDRRNFLKIGGGAIVALTLPRCAGGNDVAIGDFSGGNVSDYALGDVQRFGEGPFFVMYDEGGF